MEIIPCSWLSLRPGSRSIALAAKLVLLLLAGGAPAARASGFHNEDFGVRRMGMFTVVARPDDGTTVFHNPAGLTLCPETCFYHSQSWFYASLGLRLYDSEGRLRPEHEISPDWNIGFLPFFGVISALGTESLRLGLSLYAPNAYGASLPDDEPTRYHATGALFVSSRATLSAAWAVSPRLSLGANLSLVHNYLTMSRIFNLAVLEQPDRRFDPPEQTRAGDGTLDLEGSSWSHAWDVGVLLHPTERLRLGAAFFSGSPVELEGDVVLKYQDGSEERTRQHTLLVIPFTLRAGVNWEPSPRFELGADIRYYHYQVFQEQRTTFDRPLKGQTGLVDAKSYDNAWNWSVGVLYRPLEGLELMGGYQEDYTPIPTATFTR
ncbi:MAG: TonB-dependent receptor [Deltaproteobacteria bacterium]|nr:TonB-dependent receptor [Deltaproteobacteria bacterium]